jgi:hypothetical protein
MTLVREGAPAATIVVGATPSRAAAFAVRELNDHIRKITGTNLPVVTEATTVSGPRILVGESAASRAQGLRGADFAPQEHAIQLGPDTVVLLGRDQEERRPDQSAWVSGKWGGAIEFNRGQFLYVPDSGFEDREGSIEVWVYRPKEGFVDDGTIARLQGRDNNGRAPISYHLVQTLANHCVAYSALSPDGQRALTVSAPLAEGWHFVRATHSATAGTLTLAVDGVAYAPASYKPTALAGAALSVGGVTPQHWGEWPEVRNGLRGRIDGLRVSSRARRTEEPWNAQPLAADADTTLLVNFDEGQGSPRDESRFQRVVDPPWYFEDRGTLDATYDFLERQCGVRWYLPGELGTSVEPRSTLTVSGSNLRRKPAMEYRWMVWSPFYLPGPARPAISDADATLWKLRLRLGGAPYQVNHSFTGYFEDHLARHPDWFAQGYSGRPPQPCFSSTGLLAQVVQDARDYFDGKGLKPGAMGQGDVFAVVPQDSESWCKCPACQAQLDPRYGENYPLWINGRASQYIFGFANQVAREVAKTHPGKFIGTLAYSKYGYYPEGLPLEPNLAVQICLQVRNWYSPVLQQNDRKTFSDWTREGVTRPTYLWLYYCFPALQTWAEGWQFFPGFFAHTVAEQMALYHQAGIRGIFLEHSGEFGQTFLMDQLELYLTWKLADDPDQDANQLIHEFFSRYYGAAGSAMQELYQQIEQTYMTSTNYPPDVQNKPGQWHQTEQIAWEYLGTPSRMERWAGLISRAKAEADTPLARQRVALFEEGLWQPMVKASAAYAAKQPQEAARRRLQSQPPARLAVPRIASAQGDLQRVDWRPAAATTGDWFTVTGYPSGQQLKAWWAHDGEFLYVKVEHLRDATGLVSNDAIWGGDDWEVFFAGSRQAQPRQLMLNPAGKVAAVAHDRPDAKWDSGAVAVSDTSDRFAWRASFAFPLSALVEGGVKPDGVVFANLYRSNAGRGEYFAWSPNFELNFRTSQRMVELWLAD